MDEYIAALQAHDWYYSYSDDHRVWKSGFENARQLQEMRHELDTDYTVWNQHAPDDCKYTP